MINEEVKCTLGVSEIHGVGVFAIRDIKKGEHLYPFTEADVELTEDISSRVLKVILDRNVIYKNTKTVEHPNLEVNYPAFMNHSNNPNSDGVYALKDIEEGEEITENYRHDDMSDASKKHFTFL